MNKSLPALEVAGNAEFEGFDNAFRKVITVCREDLLKAESKWKLARARERANKP